MGTKVEAPEPRNYAQETRDTLQAQVDLAPQLYAAEASEEYGQPAYARTGLRALQAALEGDANVPGVLAQYEQNVMPAMSRMESTASSTQRAGDLGDVEQYGQRATNALLNSDPYKRQLSDELSRQALEELKAGATLDPSLRREVQQGYRQAASARGMGYNPSSAAEEAYFTGLKAEQLRRGRQAFAAQALGQRQALTGDPFLQILGRPGQSFSASQGVFGQGAGIGATAPRLFSPESQYSADIYAGNQQSQLAARTASAQAKSAMISGIAQGLGSLGGGYLAGR